MSDNERMKNNMTMHTTKRFLTIFLKFMLAGFLLSGCNLMGLLYPEATPTVIPTPTPQPLKEVSICLGSEPRSLYPYRAVASAEQEVLSALTDGPVDTLASGEQRAVLLESLPGFEDGSAAFNPVTVNAGDVVVNSEGFLVTLEAGVSVFPSGCTSPGCVLTWDGASPLQLGQLSVTFKMKDGLKWSDGETLTADDSVYAFNLAADPATPVSKHLIDLTADYTALDARTIAWHAVPGLVTADLAPFFWAPLPAHAWEGLSADALLADDISNRNPLSYGPFMVEEWTPGSHIRLVRNPYYHRADERLPAADSLTFKFLSAADPASVLTAAAAECDLVSSSVLDLQDILYLRENAAGAGMRLGDLSPGSVEILALGITPASYDNNYYPFGVDRPDIFGDVRVRQALAYCIDQSALINQLMDGGVEAARTILAPDNPLIAELELAGYAHDPAQGVALLQQVGWQDSDFNPDTPLTAVNVLDVPPATVFEVELLSSPSPLRAEVAAEIASNLSACGIRANITQKPLDELYQPGPDGPIFGRQFDLALLSLQVGTELDCRLFRSNEIPSDANHWLGETTGGANFFGYQSDAYDAQCSRSIQSGLDREGADASSQSALTILNSELPLIPLYFHPRAMLLKETMCAVPENFSMDDLFMFIEEIVFMADC